MKERLVCGFHCLRTQGSECLLSLVQDRLLVDRWTNDMLAKRMSGKEKLEGCDIQTYMDGAGDTM